MGRQSSFNPESRKARMPAHIRTAVGVPAVCLLETYPLGDGLLC